MAERPCWLGPAPCIWIEGHRCTYWEKRIPLGLDYGEARAAALLSQVKAPVSSPAERPKRAARHEDPEADE